MLTSWLWIHSPDRHRGVDVVCSNRSLGLESTSSVVNERLLIPQVHQHKKGKTALTTAENSSGEVQKIDHAPTRLLVDRSTSSTFPPDPFLAFRHHSVDNWTLLKSTSFVRSSGVRASCLETERSPLGWRRRKPQETSGIDHGEWRRVAKKSVGRSQCVRCVCVMTRCQVAQGYQNKMAKLPRTSLSAESSTFGSPLKRPPLEQSCLLHTDQSNALAVGPSPSAVIIGPRVSVAHVLKVAPA